MAPRPKTYGARRSHAKPVGKLVNGITADESEHRIGTVDAISVRIRNGKENDLGIAPKEEKQGLLSPVLREEDNSVSGMAKGECAIPSRTQNVEDMFTTLSPVSRSLRNKRKSGQAMLPADTSKIEFGQRRKSIRGSVNGSDLPKTQNLITKTGPQLISVDHHPLLLAKATSRPNGLIEDHQESSVGHDVCLTDIPSDLHNLAIWVAQLISKCRQAKSPLSATSGPKQKDSTLQPEQGIEMSDALENVEDVRMTRGKERKRLQQLKGKEPTSVPTVKLSGKFVTGAGKALRSKDAAPVERMLKESLNDELKQKLFGSSRTINTSTKISERNACGELLFNTIVDIGDSATSSSTAALKSALKERKHDVPFLSALEILASSSEVMAFVNFLFSKDDTPRCESSNADESRPSTGLETSGATTITDASDLTSCACTSISQTEAFFKNTNKDHAADSKHSERQKRSQEVIQALEAATMILVQIQQGEAGTGYITPYASGNMVSNPTGQPHSSSYGIAFGLSHPNHSVHGRAYGTPMGANLNNYASPYATPLATSQDSYASPYSKLLNQPPASYASPYANPKAPNHVSETGTAVGVNNQANKLDGHETRLDNKETHIPPQNVIRTDIKKGSEETLSLYISNQENDARKSSTKADQAINNKRDETNQKYDEATREGISNEKVVAIDDPDLDGTNIDNVKEQDRRSKNGETSSDDDQTDDDLPAAKPDDRNVTPPAEDHKLFTGERLGDFTSMENIDWLLTMSNGGKIPSPSKKRRTRSLSRSPSSQADAEVQTEVSNIINEIMRYRDWRGHPLGTTVHLFYASAEAQRLAAELERLMAIAKPVINTIIPKAESQARLRLYKFLESRAMKEKQDREIQEGMNRYIGPPVQIQQWVPPPVGTSGVQFPMPPPLPSNGPAGVPFVRRGNVIAAPPGGRNIEEEKKAETYGYPPTPGSRPGDSPQGQKRKRSGRR